MLSPLHLHMKIDMSIILIICSNNKHMHEIFNIRSEWMWIERNEATKEDLNMLHLIQFDARFSA